jgi:hypothetical protein
MTAIMHAASSSATAVMRLFFESVLKSDTHPLEALNLASECVCACKHAASCAELCITIADEYPTFRVNN